MSERLVQLPALVQTVLHCLGRHASAALVPEPPHCTEAHVAVTLPAIARPGDC
jgi:hypothetical protein